MSDFALNKKRMLPEGKIREIIPFISLILVIVFFQIVTGGTLLSFRNLKLILNQSFVLMVGSVASSFIVAQGDVDFSMGSMVGITAVCAAWVSQVCAGGNADRSLFRDHQWRSVCEMPDSLICRHAQYADDSERTHGLYLRRRFRQCAFCTV